MANWATTDYAIEGSKESLQKIYQAIINPGKYASLGDEGWEGAVLKALGIEWDTDKYVRGFIQETSDIEFNPEEDEALRFYAQEAWETTDFGNILEKNFPDIKVYYCTEESNMEIYVTNDKEGKYFPARFFVDTCIDGNYNSEYFVTEEKAYKWLSKITDNRINNEDDVDEFNADYEDSDASDENFICIYQYDVKD